MRLFIPYVADVKIGKEWFKNLEVTKLNAKTAWVKLEDGTQVKLHGTKDRHRFKIRPVDIGGNNV